MTHILVQVPGHANNVDRIIRMRRHQTEAVIGVAVIEDQQETREGISLLINRTDGFQCRHLYGSMEAALGGAG